MEGRSSFSGPGRGGVPDDELILAAIRRAVRHGPPERAGAFSWTVLEHLAIARRSGPARAVRRRLAELERGGLLRTRSLHGVALWELTLSGTRRLARAERSPRPPILPESPQHLAWRAARTAAGQEIGRFREGLARALSQAEEMLAAQRAETGDGASSDDWFELGVSLQSHCRRLGSARHCLYEWSEPDDRESDRDRPWSGDDVTPRLRALRAGRRNIGLWDQPDR